MIPSDDEKRAERIARLNDQVRKLAGLPSVFIQKENPHLIVMTRGISSLPPETQFAIYALIREFDAFTEDNDFHGEHDFGVIEHEGHKVFFKFDYYADREMKYGSAAPDDPTKTVRVMTILLAEEY